MILFGQLSQAKSDPELLIGILAVSALVCYGAWTLMQWVLRGPTPPDPWDENIASEIEKDEAIPLCHRCLAPYDSATEFCSKCGTTVGQYTNWLPYPYLFSVGHTLRIGTSEDFNRSPLTVFGFFVFSLAEYALFAPVYWAVFLWKLLQPRLQKASPDQPPPEVGGTNI
jgi:hypothetical protein